MIFIINNKMKEGNQLMVTPDVLNFWIKCFAIRFFAI